MTHPNLKEATQLIETEMDSVQDMIDELEKTFQEIRRRGMEHQSLLNNKLECMEVEPENLEFIQSGLKSFHEEKVSFAAFLKQNVEDIIRVTKFEESKKSAQ